MKLSFFLFILFIFFVISIHEKNKFKKTLKKVFPGLFFKKTFIFQEPIIPFHSFLISFSRTSGGKNSSPRTTLSFQIPETDTYSMKIHLCRPFFTLKSCTEKNDEKFQQSLSIKVQRVDLIKLKNDPEFIEMLHQFFSFGERSNIVFEENKAWIFIPQCISSEEELRKFFSISLRIFQRYGQVLSAHLPEWHPSVVNCNWWDSNFVSEVFLPRRNIDVSEFSSGRDFSGRWEHRDDFDSKDLSITTFNPKNMSFQEYKNNEIKDNLLLESSNTTFDSNLNESNLIPSRLEVCDEISQKKESEESFEEKLERLRKIV